MILAALVTLGGVALGWSLNEITRARTAHAEIERRRTDFQHATLLELQEAVNEVTHLTVDMTEERIAKVRELGADWSDVFAAAEAQEASRAAHRRAYILLSRVQDNELRERATEVLLRAVAAARADNPTGAGEASSDTAELALVALRAIGEHLRTLL